MQYVEYTAAFLQIVTLLTIGWIVKSYLPSYFTEKGKNLATKEDIGRITDEVEKVRTSYAAELERTKIELQERLENIKYQLSISAEISKHHQSLQSQAYVDFIRAIAGIAIAQKHEDGAKELEASILLTDAKARIAVYGSKEVLKRMGQFFEDYGALTSREAMVAFVEAIREMRDQTVAKHEGTSAVPISQLLFSTSLGLQTNRGEG